MPTCGRSNAETLPRGLKYSAVQTQTENVQPPAPHAEVPLLFLLLLFFKDMKIYLEKEKLLCRYESKDIPSEVNIIPLLSKFINNKCTIFLLSLAAGGEVVSKHSFFQIN